MAIIRMKYTLLDEIARYATGHLPEEACGLIAGSEDETGRLIEKVYYLTNVDHGLFYTGSERTTVSNQRYEGEWIKTTW